MHKPTTTFMGDYSNDSYEDPRALLLHAPIGIHLLGADGTILWANDYILEILGYKTEEYVGHNIFEFHLDQETINLAREQFARAEVFSNFEARFRCKDGHVKILEINSNFYLKNESFVHTRCFMRDVTELKVAQAKLRQEQFLNLSSEEKYQNRQNSLVDTICHELRNPLNGIQASLELLRDEILSLQASIKQRYAEEETASSFTSILEHITNMNECARHQKVIMDDVLSLSKLESREIRMEDVEFSPDDAIQSVVRIFTSTIDQKELTVNIHIDALDIETRKQLGTDDGLLPVENIRVCADVNRFKQILIHLLSNSVKFCGQRGEITITAQLKSVNSTKYALCVSVKDNGVGMTREERDKLISRLNQLSNRKRTTGLEYTPTKEGTGLGLVICKKLAQLMGGDIQIESEFETGSTFSFSINLKDARVIEREGLQNQSQTIPENCKVERRSANHSNKHKFLIVEDNLINQKVLANVLRLHGHSYDIANSGEEAILMMFSTTPCPNYDLVFMDIEMLGMNGFETTQHIRMKESELHLKSVPVICVSGYARSEYQKLAESSGMQAFITKPFKKDAIYREIDRWLPAS